MKIGERIKQAIEKAGIPQEQVAAHAEMSLANLYKVYKRDSIETRYLVKIAEKLDLPYSYFLDDEPDLSGGTYQSGIGNAGGNIHDQKIMAGKEQAAGNAPDDKVVKLQHELALCEAEKASLAKEVALKDEIIELLRGQRS